MRRPSPLGGPAWTLGTREQHGGLPAGFPWSLLLYVPQNSSPVLRAGARRADLASALPLMALPRVAISGCQALGLPVLGWKPPKAAD